MAQLPVTRWLARVVPLLLLPRLAPAAPPATPLAPQLWPTQSLQGADFVSARDLARRFDLKTTWAGADLTMTLSDAGGPRFVFAGRERDFHFDSLRVFLGRRTLADRDTVWISKLDVIKIVAPLFRPADHLAQLPATAPKVIVLDPGHGGIDPGTQNPKVGINEKTATLDVALRLARLLEARGWRVLLVRDRDIELSRDKKTDLLMRDEFANRNHADLYLSIHFNNAIPSVTGVETYVMTPQFMWSSADEQGDDMTRVAYPGNRLDFANLLLGEQLHRAMITGLKAADRGFKHGREAVLRMLDCPGALVECAYLSNDAEARRVATPEYQQKIAEALATGLQNYSAELAALHAPSTPRP